MNVPKDMNRGHSTRVGSEAERWLVRLQSRNCSESERASFQAWLQADPAHERAYRTAEHYWRRVPELANDGDLRAVVEASRARLARRRAFWEAWKGMGRTPAWASALVLVAAVGVGMLGHRAGWWMPAPVSYATLVGERRSVELEDGSVLTLNTNSEVEIRYGRGARQVNLMRGEAQFDVHRDPDRPFSVMAGEGRVVALGTRFQVRADAESMVVSLLEGRVRVTGTASNDTQVAELLPGDRLTIPAQHHAWRRSTFDPDNLIDWTQGRLEFRAVPLHEAIEEINRYTTRELRLADDSLDDIKVNGIFDTGDVEGVLGALEYVYPVRVDRTASGAIILSHR